MQCDKWEINPIYFIKIYLMKKVLNRIFSLFKLIVLL